MSAIRADWIGFNSFSSLNGNQSCGSAVVWPAAVSTTHKNTCIADILSRTMICSHLRPSRSHDTCELNGLIVGAFREIPLRLCGIPTAACLGLGAVKVAAGAACNSQPISPMALARLGLSPSSLKFLKSTKSSSIFAIIYIQTDAGQRLRLAKPQAWSWKFPTFYVTSRWLEQRSTRPSRLESSRRLSLQARSWMLVWPGTSVI